MGGSAAKEHDAAKRLGYNAGKITAADNNLTAAETEKLIRLLPTAERQARYFFNDVSSPKHTKMYFLPFQALFSSHLMY